jgi:hypothetical protein
MTSSEDLGEPIPATSSEAETKGKASGEQPHNRMCRLLKKEDNLGAISAANSAVAVFAITASNHFGPR